MSCLMSSGNIVSLLDFRVLGGMAQMISFEPLKNGCSSYFSPDARCAWGPLVPEDMNDIRYLDVSDLLSVEGNDGSVVDCSVCDDSEGNSSDSHKSVTWSSWLTVFDADGRYVYENRDADVVGVMEPNVLVREPWDNDGWLLRGIIPGTWGSYFSCALWYMRGSSCVGCQDCNFACRYYWEKSVEQGWDSLIWCTTAC